MKCGSGSPVSQTRKELIALNYCYSLTTLNGSLPKISLKCLLLILGYHKMKSLKSGNNPFEIIRA